MTEPGTAATLAGPREVFARMRQSFIDNTGLVADQLAEDVIIETPFAAPGSPRRMVGRTECLAFTGAGRAALPVRFEECRNVMIHETADPEKIIVEYELAGVVTTTGRRAAAPFIGVLRVRNGRIAQWREYQDTLTIAHTLGQLPALVAALGTDPAPSAPPPVDS